MVDSRVTVDGVVRRRRRCEACQQRFTTYELVLDKRRTAAYVTLGGNAVDVHYVRPLPNAVVFLANSPAVPTAVVPDVALIVVELFTAMARLGH